MDIYTRKEWNARYGSQWRPTMKDVSEVFLHTIAVEYNKTSFEDSVKHLQSIENYHHDKNGWTGIGYSWLIDTQGRVFEGRGLRVPGGHTQGHNSSAYGVAFFGHGDKQYATQAQIEAFGDLLRYLALEAKVLKENYKVRGHREVSSKSCPGNLIYPLIQNNTWDALKILQPARIPATIENEVFDMVSVQHLYLEAFGRKGSDSEIGYWEGEIKQKGEEAIKELTVFSNEAKQNAEDGPWVKKITRLFGVQETESVFLDYLNTSLMSRAGVVDSILILVAQKKILQPAVAPVVSPNNSGTTVVVQADKDLIVNTIIDALKD